MLEISPIFDGFFFKRSQYDLYILLFMYWNWKTSNAICSKFLSLTLNILSAFNIELKIKKGA
jgi:hypothetical protein